MTWTYDPVKIDDANEGDLMKVRLLIGDTDSSDTQLQDEEIEYFIESYSTVYGAASAACSALAAKYARQVDKKVGDLALAASKRSEHYKQLAEDLNTQGLMSYAVPSAGGIEKADRDAHRDDETVLHGSIKRGLHDFIPEDV